MVFGPFAHAESSMRLPPKTLESKKEKKSFFFLSPDVVFLYTTARGREHQSPMLKERRNC
jgi:hypothetical protein